MTDTLSAIRNMRAAGAHTTTTADHDAPQIPSAPDAEFVIPAATGDAVRAAMRAGIPAIVAGPAGTGKTELIAAAAHAAGRPLHIVDCGGIRDPLDWFGALGLSNGRTEWQPTALPRALATPGCVVLLDEINRASTIAQNTLLPLLDSRRCVRLPLATITSAPSVWIVATANEGAEYAATGAIDHALRSRLAVRIECGWMPQADEARMLVARTGCSAEEARTITAVAAQTRRADWIDAHGFALDTRATLAVARMLAALASVGGAPIVAWQTAALAHAEQRGGMGTSARSALAQVLASHGIG